MTEILLKKMQRAKIVSLETMRWYPRSKAEKDIKCQDMTSLSMGDMHIAKSCFFKMKNTKLMFSFRGYRFEIKFQSVSRSSRMETEREP